MPNDRPFDELDELTIALKQLLPAGRIDRDRVMYLAGRQSAATPRARGAWLWPTATGLASAIAVALAVLLAVRPDAADRSATTNLAELCEIAPLAFDVGQPDSQFRLRRELLAGTSLEAARQSFNTQSQKMLRPRDFRDL